MAEPARLPPPEEGAVRLDPERPVWVDRAERSAAVDGRVCLREGVLEMFACPAGTKEHESIVAVDSTAFLLHTALLAAGAEPGKPARFEPEFRPPEGPEIEVAVEWVDEDGATQRARAQQWIRNDETGEEMKLPFVFGGSGFWTDPDTGRQRYLAESGDLICVSNFGTAMLDVPAESTQSNDALLYEPFTERIPPVDTPVRVWLTVKSEKTSAAPRADEPPTVDVAITALRSISITRGSTESQRAAWEALAGCAPEELVVVLRAMGESDVASQNWMRTAVDAASQRMSDEGALPRSELSGFLNDTSQPPRARRVAYEILAAVDPASAGALLEGLLNDPSLELRYDAVQSLLDKAADADETSRRSLYASALGAARTLPQIEAAAKGLESLGDEVDLVAALGMVTDWRLIGPFDNRGGGGFGVAYPPESELRAEAEYEGVADDDADTPGVVRWKPHRTDDRLGDVDLNGAVGAHKGAAAYAWATVVSDRPRAAELRYTTRNATKLWVNGELVADNEVYHSGSGFDQFRAEATLRAGANEILLKVCQNEQTQPWAQVWDYRLRVCDGLGGPIEGVRVVSREEKQP